MGFVTILLGAFLAAVGLIGYVATAMEHPTALIPTGFGLVFVVLGVLARQEKMRMHVMHVSVLLGLAGFVFTVMGVPALVRMLSGEVIERPAAAIARSVMAAACLVYVLLCIRSFIEARRRRREQQSPQAKAG
jgi:zinc transporter ZupT